MTWQFFNRQIVASQDRMLRRFVFDASYTRAMAQHPSNACISDWLPGGTGEKLLEIGCGPGKYVAMLNALGYQVTGVDPHEFSSWDLLRKETSAQLINNVRAENLPFPDNSFDHAVCLGALLYFDEPEQALRQARRVLKPSGRIIVRTVNKTNLYTLRTGRKLDPASKNLYTLSELAALIEKCGFDVTKKFSYGFWPPMLTDFWWYLTCVFLPLELQHKLSSLLKPEHRVSNIAFARSTKT